MKTAVFEREYEVGDSSYLQTGYSTFDFREDLIPKAGFILPLLVNRTNM
jgi:hypothetical protein